MIHPENCIADVVVLFECQVANLFCYLASFCVM